MVGSLSLEEKIKNKIRDLITEKKIKKNRLSEQMGFHKGFMNSILGRPDKFFNLEHIEKICNALDYPVHFLFVEDEKPQETGLGEDIKELVNGYRALTPDHQNQIREMVQAFKLTEEMGGKDRKKNSGNAA